MVNKVIKSIKVSQRKKRVIQKILSAPQQHKDVVNLHSIDPNNVGDYYCGPHHYFKEINKTIDIFDFKKPNKKVRENFIEKITSNSIIVGGGGLLNRGGFKRQMKLMEDLSKIGKKVVLWGIGHNEKDPSQFGKIDKYSIDISQFKLAGTRDINFPGTYLPCVSCLNNIFDNDFQETQEIGFVLHHETVQNKQLVNRLSQFPLTSNSSNFRALISFIGQTEYLITDSYHAMYWGILMNKKVTVIPNSSKFYDFKYKPIFSDFDNCLIDRKKAIKHTGVLEESRKLNINFSEKVFDYLNL